MPHFPEPAIEDYEKTFAEVAVLLEDARRSAAGTVNDIMTSTYCAIGRRIVHHEQTGQAQLAAVMSSSNTFQQI